MDPGILRDRGQNYAEDRSSVGRMPRVCSFTTVKKKKEKGKYIIYEPASSEI